MATRKPVQKERFLLWMLAGVFGFQIAVFSGAVVRCSQYTAEEAKVACPDLGRRYDQTFGVMIATILALLSTSKSKNT